MFFHNFLKHKKDLNAKTFPELLTALKKPKPAMKKRLLNPRQSSRPDSSQISTVDDTNKIFKPAIAQAFRFNRNNIPRFGASVMDALVGKIPLSNASLDCITNTLWDKMTIPSADGKSKSVPNPEMLINLHAEIEKLKA